MAYIGMTIWPAHNVRCVYRTPLARYLRFFISSVVMRKRNHPGFEVLLHHEKKMVEGPNMALALQKECLEWLRDNTPHLKMREEAVKLLRQRGVEGAGGNAGGVP